MAGGILLENQDIPARRQTETDRIARARAAIVLFEFGPQAARLDSHDGIDAGIAGFVASEDFKTKVVFS